MFFDLLLSPQASMWEVLLSNLHKTPGTLLIFLTATHSFAIKIAIVICLPFIKANCEHPPAWKLLSWAFQSELLIKSCKCFSIRLMGLKSFNSFAPIFFGISAMKVTLKLFPKKLWAWKFYTAATTSLLTTSQQAMKNAMVWFQGQVLYP